MAWKPEGPFSQIRAHIYILQFSWGFQWYSAVQIPPSPFQRQRLLWGSPEERTFLCHLSLCREGQIYSQGRYTLLSKFHHHHSKGRGYDEAPQKRELSFAIFLYAGKVKYTVKVGRKKLWILNGKIQICPIFVLHLQPFNYQVSKSIVHEMKFGDIAVM